MKDSAPDTQKHINRVRVLIRAFSDALLVRGILHDRSKLEAPEKEDFDKFTESLSKLTYGSEEYKKSLQYLGPALKHHYENNKHHPENRENGINGMTLVDITEMLCDWKASSERHENGDIFKSLKINTERFQISPQLLSILENTAKELF